MILFVMFGDKLVPAIFPTNCLQVELDTPPWWNNNHATIVKHPFLDTVRGGCWLTPHTIFTSPKTYMDTNNPILWLKGNSSSKPSFLGSMLVFGSVHVHGWTVSFRECNSAPECNYFLVLFAQILTDFCLGRRHRIKYLGSEWIVAAPSFQQVKVDLEILCF